MSSNGTGGPWIQWSVEWLIKIEVFRRMFDILSINLLCDIGKSSHCNVKPERILTLCIADMYLYRAYVSFLMMGRNYNFPGISN